MGDDEREVVLGREVFVGSFRLRMVVTGTCWDAGRDHIRNKLLAIRSVFKAMDVVQLTYPGRVDGSAKATRFRTDMCTLKDLSALLSEAKDMVEVGMPSAYEVIDELDEAVRRTLQRWRDEDKADE